MDIYRRVLNNALILDVITMKAADEGFSKVNKLRTSVRSNNCLSCGLKSRPGSFPYAPVAQGSGVLATGGREFPIGKVTGRNVSEPICSLVNKSEGADSVDVWGRPLSTNLENGSGLWNLPG
jgi:hypothetical protein